MELVSSLSAMAFTSKASNSKCVDTIERIVKDLESNKGHTGKLCWISNSNDTSLGMDAIAMAVIGGVSLQGGRGSIFGTVLGALIFGVIISGFTFLKLDAYYQEMVKGVIIVGAVVLDQWRQKNRGRV
jgi:ribose/xylose/arabinose/galactoside ABC-type transport system permease subunit